MAETPDSSQSQTPDTGIEVPSEAPSLAEQIEYVRGLAQVVAEEGLSELEIEGDGLKISLKAPVAPVVVPMPVVGEGVPFAPLAPAASGAPASAPPAKAKPAEKFTPLVSPMVGVFYRAPSPADPNFIEVGDRVERGQTIGLIEAMKVFNEITAEAGGVVAEIVAQNGALVETGQPLALLK